MANVISDEFVTDEMDDGEEVHRYRPGVCILSILVIHWTAVDTKSFTSLATALLRPYGWLEISVFANMLL